MATARSRWLSTRSGAKWPAVAAAVLAGAVFIQTAWFSSFLAFGNLMNILVGVCLIGLLLLALQTGCNLRSRTSSLVAASALGVTANSWQLLLPVAGMAVTSVVRRASSREGVVVPATGLVRGLGVLLSVNGVLGLRILDGEAQAVGRDSVQLVSPRLVVVGRVGARNPNRLGCLPSWVTRLGDHGGGHDRRWHRSDRC